MKQCEHTNKVLSTRNEAIALGELLTKKTGILHVAKACDGFMWYVTCHLFE